MLGDADPQENRVQKVKLQKRQKILAVLHSVLEKKRKESTEDLADYSYPICEDDRLNDSPEDVTMPDRKRPSLDTLVGGTACKRPLLDSFPAENSNIDQSLSTTSKSGDRPSDAKNRFLQTKYAPSSNVMERRNTVSRACYTKRNKASFRSSRFRSSQSDAFKNEDVRCSGMQRTTSARLADDTDEIFCDGRHMNSRQHVRRDGGRGLLEDGLLFLPKTKSSLGESRDFESRKFIGHGSGVDELQTFTRPPSVRSRFPFSCIYIFIYYSLLPLTHL